MIWAGVQSKCIDIFSDSETKCENANTPVVAAFGPKVKFGNKTYSSDVSTVASAYVYK